MRVRTRRISGSSECDCTSRLDRTVTDMTSTNPLNSPDIVNAPNTIRMLEHTGIALDPTDHELLAELETLAQRSDHAAVAAGFLAPQSSQLSQRWAVFCAAHLYDGDPPQTLPRPKWTLPSGQRGRPMTRLEQAICRVTVDRWPTPGHVTAAQYALAEVSATSGELAALAVNAVALGTKARVQLDGGRDQNERMALLDPWGTQVLLRRMTTLGAGDPKRPFVYNGDAPASAKAQASASGNLARVLHFAGLGEDRTLNPTSIRNTLAVRRYEEGDDIETVARSIGARSLDKVRRILDTCAA